MGDHRLYFNNLGDNLPVVDQWGCISGGELVALSLPG